MRRQSYHIGIALFFSCGLTISAVAEPIVPRTATLSITRGELTFDHDSDDPFARGELFGVGFSLFLDLEQTDRFGWASAEPNRTGSPQHVKDRCCRTGFDERHLS